MRNLRSQRPPIGLLTANFNDSTVTTTLDHEMKEGNSPVWDLTARQDLDDAGRRHSLYLTTCCSNIQKNEKRKGLKGCALNSQIPFLDIRYGGLSRLTRILD